MPHSSCAVKPPSPRQLLPRQQRVAERLGSNGKSWIEFSSTAILRPYLSMNDPTKDRVEWLASDCDHGDYDGFPGSLPKPVCTTITRATGRHHHLWRLSTPVLTGEGARPKPLALLAAVQSSLVFHLNADPHFTNTLTKNPWHPEWTTIWWGGKPVELKDFEPWLLDRGEKLPAANGNTPLESCGYSRNVDVFDHARHWAYRNWDGDREPVYSVAHDFNAKLAMPLPMKEVDGIAKSICKFMEERYTGTPRASKTRDTTRQAKVNAILAAEHSIRASGQRPTIDMIAAVTGINRATVSRIQQTL